MDENERYEFVLLHGSGALPGIPGELGAGSYVLDWQERKAYPATSLEAFLAEHSSAVGTGENEPPGGVAGEERAASTVVVAGNEERAG